MVDNAGRNVWSNVGYEVDKEWLNNLKVGDQTILWWGNYNALTVATVTAIYYDKDVSKWLITVRSNYNGRIGNFDKETGRSIGSRLEDHDIVNLRPWTQEWQDLIEVEII